MPDLVQVQIVVDRETLDRYVYAAERRSTTERTVTPARVIAEALRDDAQFLPQRPRPAAKRTQAEVRDESRARRGGVSAHTEALRVIRPQERQ